MANYGYVHTKKDLDRDEITAIFKRLNETAFQNLFNIEYLPKDKNGFGEHFWRIEHKTNGDLYGTRHFWIEKEKPRTFYTEHKGGGDSWIYYVVSVIFNEIALSFSGKIGDDGSSLIVYPKKPFDTFQEYLNQMWIHQKTIPSFVWETVPPEFNTVQVTRESLEDFLDEQEDGLELTNSIKELPPEYYEGALRIIREIRSTYNIPKRSGDNEQ